VAAPYQPPYIGTGDESWFYDEYLQGRLWISSAENALDYPNGAFATEKQMLALFSNPDGSHIMTILQQRAPSKVAWLIDQNLVLLRDHFLLEGRRLGQNS
jgi:hypothetical protein